MMKKSSLIGDIPDLSGSGCQLRYTGYLRSHLLDGVGCVSSSSHLLKRKFFYSNPPEIISRNKVTVD